MGEAMKKGKEKMKEGKRGRGCRRWGLEEGGGGLSGCCVALFSLCGLTGSDT